jgi:hypothetical protein
LRLTSLSEMLCRMGNESLSLTKGVSQMSGHSSVTLTDDLLNTKRMTIEDLIEANEVRFLYT